MAAADHGDPVTGIGRGPQFRLASGDRAVAMGSIDKYIFRTTLASFAVVLISLTGVIWITQALRGIDLMTSQGQTIVTFLGITSLVIPALVLIIAPMALMVAFIGAYLAPDGMRRIKQWDAEITADVLTNILQPGRFA